MHIDRDVRGQAVEKLNEDKRGENYSLISSWSKTLSHTFYILGLFTFIRLRYS